METETIDNEQEAVQEVQEETTNEENATETIEKNNIISVYDNVSSSNEVSNEEISESIQEQATEVTSGENTELGGETSEPIEVDSSEETSTLLIEEKLDTIIQLESHQFGASLFLIASLSFIIVIYLFYKFITNFFEF